MTFLPGLTSKHFTEGSCRQAPTPELISSRVHLYSGRFYIEWKAEGSRNREYSLWAKGNIKEQQNIVGTRRWWGFQCHCTCRNFEKQEIYTLRSGDTVNYVCKHLAAALTSVIDAEAYPITQEEKAVLPGLTLDNFMNDGSTHGDFNEPLLTNVHINEENGNYELMWEIDGRYGDAYDLSTSGSILGLDSTTSCGSDLGLDLPEEFSHRSGSRAETAEEQHKIETVVVEEEKREVSKLEELVGKDATLYWRRRRPARPWSKQSSTGLEKVVDKVKKRARVTIDTFDNCFLDCCCGSAMNQTIS